MTGFDPPTCVTSCLCLLDCLRALSPTVRRAQETAVTVSVNVVFFLCSPMVNWRLVSLCLRPTNICVIQKSDTDLITFLEPSQSTYWKLALASAPDLKMSSQNLLHIHVTFPQLQAPALDSHPSPQLKCARHDILAFYFSASLASTFPHCFRRTILKKKKITQYICEISEHCLCRHVPCVSTLTIQKRSPTHLLQVMCF